MKADPLQSAASATFRTFGRIGASYPVYFNRPDCWDVVPAEELLRVENLRTYFVRAISEWSDHPSEEDQRAAASRFLRRYVGSIAAAALIPLSAGVALDVAIPRVQVLIRSDLSLGTVIDLAGATVYVSAERPTTWPVAAVSLSSVEELRIRAYQSLFGDHLVPAFERIRSAVSVSERMIWAQVAESIDYMYDNARPYVDDAGWARLSEDRSLIDLADTIPGIPGANPMKGLVEWEDSDDPDDPGPHQIRRICCINYVIPGRAGPGYCQGCGLLTAEERTRLRRQYAAGHRAATSCRWPPLG